MKAIQTILFTASVLALAAAGTRAAALPLDQDFENQAPGAFAAPAESWTAEGGPAVFDGGAGQGARFLEIGRGRSGSSTASSARSPSLRAIYRSKCRRAGKRPPSWPESAPSPVFM